MTAIVTRLPAEGRSDWPSAAAQSKADTEARRLMKVFARVSQAVQENPAGVYEQLRQRPETPRRELEEFRQLLHLH